MAICSFCEKSPGGFVYLINPEGGYGKPEMWACRKCMEDAPKDSYLGFQWSKWKPELDRREVGTFKH